MSLNILVGCDPEVFVKKDGKLVSAFGLIPGTKEAPHRVPDGAVQVDGMALEFNINPAKSELEFIGNIQSVFDALKKMVPGHEIATIPVADFGAEYIASQPALARELGCDPDYDAATGMVNVKPNMDLPFRTASGHVHIGWGSGFSIDDVDHDDKCRAVALQMDAFLGLPSLFFDKDTRRRAMYGRASCYRRKSYGMEYRTLSNQWLQNEKLMAWVYRAVMNGMDNLIKGVNLFERYPDIPRIINESDVKAAEKIIKKEKLEVCYG